MDLFLKLAELHNTHLDAKQISQLVFGYVRNETNSSVPDIPKEIYNAILSFHGEIIRGSIGIKNIGNTGWLSCVLQCLNHTPKGFRDFFINNAYKADINKTNPLGSGGTLAIEFAKLLQNMWNADKNTTAISPLSFKNSLAQFAPRYAGYGLQDAFEFMSYLLDGLHEDLNLILNKPSTESVSSNERADKIVADESWKVYKMRNDSRIVDLCQAQIKSNVICSKCERNSTVFDPYIFASVPIPNKNKDINLTIYDCMDGWLKPVELARDDAWYCSKCKDFVNATKKMDIWSSPEILIIQFKRYSYRFGGKNNTMIEYPMKNLDLAKYVMSNDNNGCKYDLYGVVFLKGQVYGSYVKNIEDEKWYKFSDESVWIAEPTESITSDAYILFYKKL